MEISLPIRNITIITTDGIHITKSVGNTNDRMQRRKLDLIQYLVVVGLSEKLKIQGLKLEKSRREISKTSV